MTTTTINAYAVTQKGGRAERFSYEREVGDSDVVVRITHCSMARGDVQFIDDDWGDAKFPLVPGHEIIGVVEETGAAVAGLAVGDRVGVGYQQGACFACEFCRSGNEQLCPQQKVIGVGCFGGAAEHICLDHRFAFRLPPALDSALSAPLLSAGLTVYSAIASANLPNPSEAAVLGAGGLGQLAIQFLRKMGHRVSAISHSPEKQAAVEQLGARYIDSSTFQSGEVPGRRFDFMLSTVNAPFDLNACLRTLRPLGKFCFVAQPLEPLPLKAGLLYDMARRTIYGSYVGSRADMVAMLAFAVEHNIRSAVHTMPFANVNEAIDLVRSGSVSTRVVLQR